MVCLLKSQLGNLLARYLRIFKRRIHQSAKIVDFVQTEPETAKYDDLIEERVCETLNESQRAAVQIGTRDRHRFTLIKGPPGTGSE
jgi:hypothetical protein